MATGSITSLGIGSGLDLQNILDQLKEVDTARLTVKENKKTELQGKVDAYNTVNAKLFSIKSDALNLSLGSNFLNNSVSVTDEDVISATVGDGHAESSYSVDVTRKAQRNSWQSAAVASKSDIMFAEPVSGITDHDTTPVTTQPETLTFYYGAVGEEQQIDVSLATGLTFTEIADEINNSSNNKDGEGNQLVKASFVLGDNDDYFIRLSAVSGGDSADSEITVAGFDWIAADTTIAIAQDDSTMYLSVAPGTTYEGTANLINDSKNNPGVTAAMIDNGDATNPYQLTLTSNNTGEDARLSLTNLAGLTEVTGAGAASLNAEFTVNGISYNRQSNTAIKDVITGVTFDLKNNGESTLNIEVSMGSVKKDIMSMVEGFNNLISYIRGTETETSDADTKDETKEDDTNPLEGSSSANRIVYQLQSLLTTVLDLDTDYTSLTDLGLKISGGTISIDEDALDKAIAADPDALKALFTGDSDKEITGLADIINDALTDMVSTTGIASTEIDQAKATITRIDEDIETETERLTRKYDTMAREFARLDSYISQLNAEGNALSSMINAFSDASNK
jgi:flagellar hook-associated protein 2